MAAYNRFLLVVMGLAFLILFAMCAHAFEASSTFLGNENGTYLVQDERDNGPPSLCFSIEKITEKLVEADPGVIVLLHESAKDKSRALVAEFSNGAGALMILEGNMVCEASPLSPMQVLIGKQSLKNSGDGIVTVQLWPPLTS